MASVATIHYQRSTNKTAGMRSQELAPWANKRCGAECAHCHSHAGDLTTTAETKTDVVTEMSNPGARTIHSRRRPATLPKQPVDLTATMPFQEKKQPSIGLTCPSSQHSLQSRRTTTAMPTHSDSVGCGNCQSDDEQWEKHSDNGAPPATNHGCGTHGCSDCGHSGQPSDASDAATIDVFKQIEALCGQVATADPNSVIASIMQFNQQRLEKASRDDVLFSRLIKRNIELTQAGEFLRNPRVDLIGFIGWGKGCIGQLTHGNGSSAVEGFLYRQNGTTFYQRLGSSLGIFNQLTPEEQRSNESIDGPFASKFAQIIEIKKPDGDDNHKVLIFNPTDPSNPIQESLNAKYPNGYGILQSKKAASVHSQGDHHHDGQPCPFGMACSSRTPSTTISRPIPLSKNNQLPALTQIKHLAAFDHWAHNSAEVSWLEGISDKKLNDKQLDEHEELLFSLHEYTHIPTIEPLIKTLKENNTDELIRIQTNDLKLPKKAPKNKKDITSLQKTLNELQKNRMEFDTIMALVHHNEQ